MKTITSTLVFILLLNGCQYIPFVKKERTYLQPSVQYKNMIVKKSLDLLKFADRKKGQVVVGDILIIKDKEFKKSFAILTLVTEDETEQYIMYNIRYLTGILNSLSNQMEKEGFKYDWSWNQMVFKLRKQLKNVE